MTLKKKRSKAKISRYQIPKAAAGGGTGDGGGPGSRVSYNPGQKVLCRVVSKEPGGYSVVDLEHGFPGYLPSDNIHKDGKELSSLFVCIDKNRLLLSEIYTAGKTTDSDESI